MALARSEPGIPILPTDFDQDPFLLNVQNGTIDLRTGELRPHRRADLISKVIPLDYDPDARCPRWDAFLREVTNDRSELVDFLHRAVGYALTGDTRERALFIGYGGGKNGKTKFYETIAALLGPYAAHTPVQTLLAKRDHDRPGNELAALRGVRFVSASRAGGGGASRRRPRQSAHRARSHHRPVPVQGVFHLHPGVQALADDQPPTGHPGDARRHLGSRQADAV